MKVPLPARLTDQFHICNDDVMAHCLAHVIDGQRGDAGGRQSLHLDSRPARTAARCRHDRGVLRLSEVEGDRDVVQWERVAERDEGGGLLGGHDAGQLRRGQGVALCQLVIPEQPEGRGAQQHGGAGRGCSTRGSFAADVHHDGSALGVCVSQLSFGDIIGVSVADVCGRLCRSFQCNTGVFAGTLTVAQSDIVSFDISFGIH